MLTLGKRISELAGRLGTIEGLQQVDQEIRTLNQRLLDPDLDLSRGETMELQRALAFLGNSISKMTRVAKSMLETAGARGIDNVG
jgi:hypothetical protein